VKVTSALLTSVKSSGPVPSCTTIELWMNGLNRGRE
jgi:hypothetical protein